MFSQKFIFIFIFEYPLRIISELIKILVDTLIEYYTDMHDVDENALSISRGGGWLSHGSFAGVAHRDMYHSPSYVSDYVASSNVQNIELYGSA